MVKKVKGLKVSKELQQKFKFNSEGSSTLGDSPDNTHEFKGQVATTGSVAVEGEVTLKERLAGFLFSPPHVDAAAEPQMVQHFVDHAEEQYEGFMVYITNVPANPVEPFNLSNKFYFCENGTWHPSPFKGQIVNFAPNLNPLYEISVPVLGTDSVPFSLDFPADLFLDADGDQLTYSAEKTGGDPLPAWLSFDATNTILSGTPAEADVGLLNLTITATDPSNESASTTQEIQILVKPVPFWHGATHDFGTYGDSSWATVLPNNMLSLDPVTGGWGAWHKIIAPDEFDTLNQMVGIDFAVSQWHSSSPAGSDDNHFQVGFENVSTPSRFVEFSIRDNGGGESLTVYMNTWQGLNHNRDGGIFDYDPYNTEPEHISHVVDFDWRIEMGKAQRHPTWTNTYYVPVTVFAKRKVAAQEIIDAGFADLDFEDLRTNAEWGSLYPTLSYDIRNKHFLKSRYTLQVTVPNGQTPEQALKFRPYVKAVQETAGGTMVEFEKFDVFVDESPVVDEAIIFGDFTIEAGQVFNQVVPADLFVDPEGEAPLTYDSRLGTGNLLPGWLTFDASTLTFSGTPELSDVGTFEVSVWGMDDAQQSSNEIRSGYQHGKRFQITVELPPNDAPIPPIVPQVVLEAPANFFFEYINDPAGWSDPDGDVLTFSASAPSWLSYNTGSDSLHGVPTTADIGATSFEIVGSDPQGATGSYSYALNVVQPVEPTEQTPAIPVFTELADGDFSTDGPGTLLYDGPSTNNVLAGAPNSTIDLLDYIDSGDMSKALVLEWTFSESTEDTYQGKGHHGKYFHAYFRTESNLYFGVRKQRDSNGHRGNFKGLHTGNSNAASGYGIDNFVASEWEYRLIVRPELFWPNGTLRRVYYGFALRKKDSSYTWDDIMRIDWSPLALPSGNSSTIEGLMQWAGTIAVLDENDANSLPLFPQIGTLHNDGGRHDGHWEDIKVFVTELDPPVAPVFNSSYNLSLSAVIDTGAWDYQLPSDVFTDANVYEVLTYSAELADGSPLPAWLSFDPATRTFSGTPQGSDQGVLSIRITATDTNALTADAMMTLNVDYPSQSTDPDTGGYDMVQFLAAANGDGTASSMVQNQDGTVAMVSANGLEPQWVTPNVTPPPGKKLVVKWEYDTLDDGNIISPGGGSMSVSTYDGGGWSWKYFQIHPGPEAYYRFAGSGYAYPTSAQGVDLYNSQFRMETTFDQTNGLRNTIMKIRPVGSTIDFDTMTAANHGNNGCYYMESDHTADDVGGNLSGFPDDDGDGWRDTKINISAYPAASDSSGNFIKFKYLRYEIVDE